MGHHSCCNKQKVRRGLWSPEEDEKLIKYISTYGHGCWSSVPRLAGLQRCGKSCRLRWINYLRPDLKRGSFSPQEESLIIELHRMVGNRWAQIAKHLPGRTDNEVKNFWNSSIKKKLSSHAVDGLHPLPSAGGELLPVNNTYPSHELLCSPDHFYIWNGTSSMPQVYDGHPVPGYNVEGSSAPSPSQAHAYNSSWSMDPHFLPHQSHHDLRHRAEDSINGHQVHIDETAPAPLQYAGAKCVDTKIIVPYDQPVPNSQKCFVPSFSLSRKLDSGSRISCFLSRPCLGSPEEPTNIPLEFMDVITGSSSSADVSCDDGAMNPSMAHWVP